MTPAVKNLTSLSGWAVDLFPTRERARTAMQSVILKIDQHAEPHREIFERACILAPETGKVFVSTRSQGGPVIYLGNELETMPAQNAEDNIAEALATGVVAYQGHKPTEHNVGQVLKQWQYEPRPTGAGASAD